jgi:RimJ/RimL family protein N-acetyltransferase
MKFGIETKRLSLREFQETDARSLYELNRDPEVLRYTGDVAFESEIRAREFLKQYNSYTTHGYGRWAVIQRETGMFIGWCGFKFNEEGFTDIGFRYFREEWNKGYATEAARACLAYGFETIGLEKIIGRAAIGNLRSIRVLEKLDMHFWKEAPCEGIPRAVYYRINARDFNKVKH